MSEVFWGEAKFLSHEKRDGENTNEKETGIRTRDTERRKRTEERRENIRRNGGQEREMKIKCEMRI